ncbi:hypothetical protein 44RRORF126c [Aeromonas phage 44RR2.8t]|uniref:Uncharacterized protein n=1 Tax=Aeromonas phage 44RR2.8t TaxID=2907963 RepID=Q6U9H6_9CAUD|nr:hypothetical protein ST44RRORF126c [Aeromonas phage 44RR2.8t]AAQ81445.1 hypothetical protein 44RRORF126c [Aeromonas phage 44RR2.8t]
MNLLFELFILSVQYSIIAVMVYVLIHGFAFFDEWRQKRPDYKMPARSLCAVQVYGMIAGAWLPLAIYLVCKLCEFTYIKVTEKIKK